MGRIIWAGHVHRLRVLRKCFQEEEEGDLGFKIWWSTNNGIWNWKRKTVEARDKRGQGSPSTKALTQKNFKKITSVQQRKEQQKYAKMSGYVVMY